MLVVGLSMTAALLFGAGQILVNQAAISGILIVATLQPGASPSPSRFLDALIGGAVALLVGQVLFPRDPVRAMGKAARPVVSDLSVALKALAEALRDGDEQRARRALEIARNTDDDLAVVLRRGRPGARDVHPAPPARAHARARAALRRGGPADGLRGAQHARAGPPRPQRDPSPRPGAARAGRRRGAARRRRARARQPARAPERDTAARRLALEAAVKATRLLQDDPGLSISVIIGQVRSTAIDLLRGRG